MSILSTNEIRKGSKIELDGDPYLVVENEFVKPGKGQAFNRMKFKNFITGNIIERTYKSGDTLKKADVEETIMQFLYKDGEGYHFMNIKNYEQVMLNEEQVSEAKNWIKENDECSIVLFNNRAITVTPPTFVNLKITYTEPAVKGNTATGRVMKKATLETGAVVDIPIFISQGETIRVDTRTGEYLDRVK
ncbi:MAG: elongation factor P [Elusimicrobiota bacterium]